MQNNLLVFILKTIKIPKTLFSISILIASLGAISTLTIPFFTGKLVDTFSLENISLKLIFFLISLFMITGLLNGVGNYLMGVVGEKINYSLRTIFFEKIVKLKTIFFDENDTGQLISRVVDDTTIINSFLSSKLPNVFPSILTFIGSLILLMVIDYQMTLISLISISLFILIIIPIGNIMHKISLNTQTETANFSAFLNKIFTEIRLVKVFNTEYKEIENSKKKLNNLYRLGVKEVLIESIITPVSSIVMLLTLVIILGVGGIRVSMGIISSGELISMIFYVFQLSNPINELLTFFTDYKKATGASDRIYKIFHEEEEIITPSNTEILNNEPIIFKNVYFSHNDNVILNNLSFTIPKNKVTAIVGPSGSGKTTILNIIERLYTISSGTIKYGSNYIYDISLSTWRKNIGYVMQDNPMINDSIKKNLLYGNSNNLTKKELTYFTKMTDSYDFINNTTNGFNTLIGERGIRLSGGQKQKLDLTRNIIKNPPVLLFDEATSNLDSESEKKIQMTIDKLNGYKTIVIVAHRLSTIKSANQIIFLENGEITGIGNHKDLLSKHKKYKSFVESQNVSI